MTREQDIQTLINTVLAMTPTFYDNPNGAYEFTCPLCNGGKDIGGDTPYPTMDDINHDTDCAWLVAKDLNT